MKIEELLPRLVEMRVGPWLISGTDREGVRQQAENCLLWQTDREKYWNKDPALLSSSDTTEGE